MSKQHKVTRSTGLGITSVFRRFKADPLANNSRYPVIRNELWANYIAFAPFDTLTRLWREQKSDIIKFYKAEDREFVRFIRDCYCNELRLIDKWAFRKKEIGLAGLHSRKEIQQILRGYATSCMIMTSTKHLDRIPYLAEYYIGKWRYPIRGFDQTKLDAIEDHIERALFEESEIADLADACEALDAGLVNISIFQKLVDELIEEKVNECRNGAPISSWRLPVEARLSDILETEIEGLLFDDPRRPILQAQVEATRLSFLVNARATAMRFGLPDYQSQAQLRLDETYAQH